MENYQQTKDFEEFLLIESIIETEFLNGIKEDLLEELKNTYKNGSNFSKSGELMNVLLKGREVLKKGGK
ncbi:hypothetical protein K9M48_01375 [Candidatus Gracilibacteria bacterium]|nr:hypothetical protein [Candidatus Gracilibacteria bacterium]